VLLRGGNYSEAESLECVRRVLFAVHHDELPRSIVVVDRELTGSTANAPLRHSAGIVSIHVPQRGFIALRKQNRTRSISSWFLALSVRTLVLNACHRDRGEDRWGDPHCQPARAPRSAVLQPSRKLRLAIGCAPVQTNELHFCNPSLFPDDAAVITIT
jgi:hypothetical protein